MKIVSDLLDAYTQHIYLPLSLVTKEGRVLYTSDSASEIKKETLKYEDLIHTAQVLERPILSSTYNQVLAIELFYYISPYLKFEDGECFILAGPFQKPSHINLPLKSDIPLLDDSLIAEIKYKFSNLYYVIHTKQNFENNKATSTEWLTIMHQISHNYFDQLNEQGSILQYLVNQLNKISTIHFSAVALKSSEGLYEIKFGAGEKIEQILYKTFYEGEGLLGNAIVHNKFFLWDIVDGQPHLDFFRRNNIYPQQLFGVPIYDHNQKIGLLFGGSYISKSIKIEEIEFLADVIKLVSNWSVMNEQLQQVSPYKILYTSWLSLVEHFSSNRYENIITEIFTIFEAFDSTIRCLATLPHNRLIWKKPPQFNHVVKHNEAMLNNDIALFSFKKDHKYLYLNLGRYGFFTFYFLGRVNENDDLLWLNSLQGIMTLLKLDERSNSSLVVFNRLYEALKELDNKKYQQATTALLFIDEVQRKIQLDKEKLQMLKNCCMVLPYSMSYLKNNIGTTKEYKLLHSLFESTNTVFDLESLLIEFINKQIVQQHQLKARLVYEQTGLDNLESIVKTCLVKVMNLSVKTQPLHPHFSKVEELPITKREKEVFQLVVDGYNNSEISKVLSISTHTVKNHLTNIFKKLNVSDRVQAMAMFYRM